MNKKSIILTVFLSIAFIFQSFANEIILQAWCWSFNTIKENIPLIAEAGYTMVQTSPANECLEGEDGGLELMSQGRGGKWYYHYQPTDWKIGNYQLGTRDDFIALCAEAEKYDIKIIVDVLPNHTTPYQPGISQEFIDAVGGIDNLYHENGQNFLSNYSDRLQATTAKMGGLPDVNTENKLFQAYFMEYMNDLIDCGADGFRFDTAKHIGLPDDPKDPKSPENDFWPIFTGKKDINGVWLKNVDQLFIHGEVLQGSNAREDAYAEFMNVCASEYGYKLRTALQQRIIRAGRLEEWSHPADPDKLITWVESHDTYANKGESAKLTNFQLRAGWAIIASRSAGSPLFFSRPQGQEATQFPGVSKIGDKGNDEFMHPEVVAVNKFNKAMAGTTEQLITGPNDQVLIISRDEGKGFVIINLQKDAPIKVSVETSLPDGKYVDKANGFKFTAKKGKLTGILTNEKIAVIY